MPLAFSLWPTNDEGMSSKESSLDKFSDHIKYIPNFLGKREDDYDEIYKELESTIKWRQDEITFYGKTYAIPRYHAWYGDEGAEYSYSGIQLPRHNWSDLLLDIKKVVERESGLSFNSVLVNLYRNGEDSNGWHADDEKELVRPISVASVSLGAARDMQFRLKGEGKTLKKILLENGSLLIMKSPCQELYQHQIPKRKKVDEGRINLTFRMVEIKK